MTTSRHQSAARAAARHLTRFHVPRLGDGGFGRHAVILDARTHALNLAHYQNAIAAAERRAGRARKYKDAAYAEAHALLTEASDYCRFFALASEFTDDLAAAKLQEYEAACRAEEMRREEAARQQLEEHAS